MGETKVLGKVRPEALRDLGSLVADPTTSDALSERRAAFRRLAALHLERSYRLASVIMGGGTEAQDAVHDAFVTAWQNWDSLRDPDRLEAWFDRIVVNTCRNRVRREHRWRIRDISDGPQPLVEDPTERVADAVVVRRAFRALEPDDRIILALRFYRDLKVDDIAHVMGIRPRAASSRLHRALQRLRRRLGELEQGSSTDD
jgi:RNA polymerase sigma-70 factor (ECF subfamily)